MVKKNKNKQSSDIINFYELDDVKAFEKESHNPNYELHQIKIPCRIVII